jgi:hypothetical protein
LPAGAPMALRDFTEDELAPYNAEVMDILQVQKANPRYVGEIGKVMKAGANRIGFVHTHDLPRNAAGCDGQGLCQLGCPTDAKQSTNVSYMPRALDAGAFLFTGFRAASLLKRGSTIEGVQAEGITTEGKRRTLTVRARATIVAMGSLLSPVFLMRNGIRLPQLGRQLSLHPCGVALGYFPDRTFDHARRIPQGFGVADLAHEGLMFEGGTIPLLAHGMMSSTGWQRLHPLCGKLSANTAYFGFMIRDTSRGRRATWPPPRFSIDYLLDEQHRPERCSSAVFVNCARMYLAAGAEEVMIPGLRHMAVARNENEVDKWLGQRHAHREISLFHAYHPLGYMPDGCKREIMA